MTTFFIIYLLYLNIRILFISKSSDESDENFPKKKNFFEEI